MRHGRGDLSGSADFCGGVRGSAFRGEDSFGENNEAAGREPFLETVKSGISYLRDNRLILTLILFLAGVNFVASAFDAALPAMILPRENGGEAVLGMVSSCAGSPLWQEACWRYGCPLPPTGSG